MDHDHDRAEHVFRKWPLREVLRAYTAQARADALEMHRFELLRHVIIQVNSTKKVELPPLPGILKGVPRRD